MITVICFWYIIDGDYYWKILFVNRLRCDQLQLILIGECIIFWNSKSAASFNNHHHQFQYNPFIKCVITPNKSKIKNLLVHSTTMIINAINCNITLLWNASSRLIKAKSRNCCKWLSKRFSKYKNKIWKWNMMIKFKLCNRNNCL